MLARVDQKFAVPLVAGQRAADQIAAREMGERGSPLRAARGVLELVTSETPGRERGDVSPPSGVAKGVVGILELE